MGRAARRAAQLAVFAFAAFGGTVFGFAPPGASMLLAVLTLALALVFCALLVVIVAVKQRKRRQQMWLYMAALFSACSVVSGLWYSSASNAAVFVWKIDGKRYIAGTELTPFGKDMVAADPIYSSKSEKMSGGIGDAESVWTKESIARTRLKLTLLYLGFVTSLAVAVFAATERLQAPAETRRFTADRSEEDNMQSFDGVRQRKLKEALIDAFPTWNALAQMVLYQLDKNLATITSQALGLDANAYELVQWAIAQGMVADLVVAARNQNPRNQSLARLSDAIGVSPTSVELEKIVNDNKLQLDPEVWREGLVTAEWRVCRIDVGGEGRGTGFLVGPDLVLTNFHVIEGIDNAAARTCRARFDHKVGRDGADIIGGRAIAFADEWLVDQSKYSKFDVVPDPKGGDPSIDELDFALIRLAEPVGDEPIGANAGSRQRGWVTLCHEPLTRAPQMVTILQHPEARPMKLSIGMVESLPLNSNGTRLRHGIPTEPGSSGSPLFDKDWKVIALHHSGDPKSIKPEYNEAIPIALITNRPKVKAALPA